MLSQRVKFAQWERTLKTLWFEIDFLFAHDLFLRLISYFLEITETFNCLFWNRMIGGGRHMTASRRRGSTATGLEVPPSPGAFKGVSPRRRRAVAVQDHKSCALIQTRLKLGELVWVKRNPSIQIERTSLGLLKALRKLSAKTQVIILAETLYAESWNLIWQRIMCDIYTQLPWSRFYWDFIP